MFDVDFNILIWQLLPVRLRQPLQYAWMRCLVTPVNWLYGQFKSFRSTNLYNLAHNGQVCYLEAALNDVFDPVSRGIYISDGPYVDPVYLYRRSEGKPVYLSRRSEVGSTPYDAPTYLYRRSETFTGGSASFIVNVPSALTFDSSRMKGVLTNKLPGKTYKIVTY